MALTASTLKRLTFPSSDLQLGVLSYVTKDNLVTVKTANYFVGSILRIGDLILCQAGEGFALLMVATVTSNASDVTSAVTVAQFALVVTP